MLDVKEGERGLRQSDAVFSHIKNFSFLAEQVKKELYDSEIKAVGVSVKPRDVEGSYMPCFLSGKAIAEMLASTHNVPISYFSHQAGHIMAALYSSGATDELITKPFVAFHISGGTTEALYVKPNSHSFDIDIIADTADISAGQAIDRVGVMMGLKFPCGKELELLADEYKGKLPKAKICVKDGKCNLSGLENIAKKLYDETGDKAYVSAYVLNFVGQTLVALTEQIRERYPDISIVYAGGVMSNKILKAKLSKFENTYFAQPVFSSDNAAGIALLTRKNY
jgi:N6-L-threonylcarbamoyladenine synthase